MVGTLIFDSDDRYRNNDPTKSFHCR